MTIPPELAAKADTTGSASGISESWRIVEGRSAAHLSGRGFGHPVVDETLAVCAVSVNCRPGTPRSSILRCRLLHHTLRLAGLAQLHLAGQAIAQGHSWQN